MNSAMRDFKPVINSGYTGKRHDDTAPLSREQVGVMSFVAGLMVAMVATLIMQVIA